ncbi:hypothetical protein HMPREF1409_01742 [Helicobacter pylori GAM246Ai]|nr:hypothetical protein HMPREF1409_01742 [Helicobacter pylori GAM246Ai]
MTLVTIGVKPPLVFLAIFIAVLIAGLATAQQEAIMGCNTIVGGTTMKAFLIAAINAKLGV